MSRRGWTAPPWRAALRSLLDRLKEAANLRDLRVIEMLFYGQLRNKDVAKIAGIDEKHVALIKHRGSQRMRDHVARRAGSTSGFGTPQPDSLVTEVWEEQRLRAPSGARSAGICWGRWKARGGARRLPRQQASAAGSAGRTSTTFRRRAGRKSRRLPRPDPALDDRVL